MFSLHFDHSGVYKKVKNPEYFASKPSDFNNLKACDIYD